MRVSTSKDLECVLTGSDILSDFNLLPLQQLHHCVLLLLVSSAVGSLSLSRITTLPQDFTSSFQESSSIREVVSGVRLRVLFPLSSRDRTWHRGTCG